MVYSPGNLEIWVDSREYSRPIQTATYPPFTKGTWEHTRESLWCYIVLVRHIRICAALF